MKTNPKPSSKKVHPLTTMIGQVLSEWRKKKRVRRTEVKRCTGLSRSTQQKFGLPTYNPSLDASIRYAEALDVLPENVLRAARRRLLPKRPR